MTKSQKLGAGAALSIACALLLAADFAPSPDRPQYTPEGRLIFPQNYREWVYLSSGFGMTYGPLASPNPMFDNVFVNPSAYRAFRQTGKWPDGTLLVLEMRAPDSKGSINRGGNYQSGVMAIETHVKDEARFPRKWAFFGFRNDAKVSETRAADTSDCYTCHEPNGAVDTTFVQFYPTLIPVATEKGTFQRSK
jgi:hypothetical protein